MSDAVDAVDTVDIVKLEDLLVDYIETREREAQAKDEAAVRRFWKQRRE